MIRIAFASLLVLSLAACGNEPTGKATTKLDAVEVQPGTISDSMIILDNADGDGTAVDNSVPDDGTKKPTAKVEQGSDEGESAAESSSDEGEAISVPVARKAQTAAPANKADE